MQQEYYFIENGKSTGPYSKEALKVFGIGKETLVWRAGIPDWVKAETLEELSDIFDDNSAFGAYAEHVEEPYFAMINGVRVGPSSVEELISKGLRADTPVWKSGMADWIPASQVADVMNIIERENRKNYSSQQVPPFYGQSAYEQPSPHNNYGMGAGMNGRYGGYSQPGMYNNMNMRPTNWMPWAIVGTIAGFLFSCIGVIFGIIGIVQANKANSAYAVGNDAAGDASNSSAKTMTIISLILAGIGLIVSVSMYKTIMGFASL